MAIYGRRSLTCHIYFVIDLQHALNLYNYMKYGIFIRSCLEHYGPYDISSFSFGQDRNKEIIDEFRSIGSIKSVQAFSKHSKEYLEAARQQLIINFFSIFEFLIGNTLIELWELSQLVSEKELGNKLYFVWPKVARDQYRADHKLSGIEDAAWLENNHKWDFLKKRIGVLSDHLNVDVKTIRVTHNGRNYGWQDFCNLREARHRVVHTAGRQSIFTSKPYEKIEISESDVLCAYKFLIKCQASIDQGIYKVPILRDDLAGKTIEGLIG